MSRPTFSSSAQLPELPLPIYGAHQIGAVTLESFGECTVFAGMTEDIVSQLITRSQNSADEALARTSDSARFATLETYATWYAQGRTPFILIHQKTNDIMALVWIGPKPLGQHPAGATSMEERGVETTTSAVWDTVSFRSYPPYRGGGFMTSFTQYVLDTYRAQYPEHRLWVSIDRENSASQALAGKLGFTLSEKADQPGSRITMCL